MDGRRWSCAQRYCIAGERSGRPPPRRRRSVVESWEVEAAVAAVHATEPAASCLASISNRTRYTCKRWSAPRLRSAAAWCGSICGASGEHLRAGAGGEEGGCAHARSFEQLGHSSWIVGRSSSRLLAESPSSGRCLMPSIGIVTDTGVLLSTRAQRVGQTAHWRGAGPSRRCAPSDSFRGQSGQLSVPPSRARSAMSSILRAGGRKGSGQHQGAEPQRWVGRRTLRTGRTAR